ncbi:MAG: 4'-phosphopantetheinyl transferase superfamily protein [Bacteroidales bacterium]|nr:4'-phosphopantetheinyl transferase superfamily protein [Lachnoclostridium sp.]MCM1385017.1 4'-phosphopantetheinyl transferase superfamily protein [Lachnoclostridium sp.]MCM1465906.1 4'-phosphopantetheinyl transferase superfamily protein [Bacteroidales bacterium]
MWWTGFNWKSWVSGLPGRRKKKKQNKDRGRKMQARGYLLNVAGLDAMEEAVLKKIDGERLKKMESIVLPEKRRACAGAGLLIQWSLYTMYTMYTMRAMPTLPPQLVEGARLAGDAQLAEGIVEELSLARLVEELPAPLSPSYIYGKRGKPYFRDIPLFFNLSHSGDYVICVVSKHETGVDIQKQKPVRVRQISNRFFHEREREWLAGLSEKERTEAFFRLWTRKEAYGKMTGEGIADAAGRDFSDLDARWLKGTFWAEYSLSEGSLSGGYKIACCVRDEEKCCDYEKINDLS